MIVMTFGKGTADIGGKGKERRGQCSEVQKYLPEHIWPETTQVLLILLVRRSEIPYLHKFGQEQ